MRELDAFKDSATERRSETHFDVREARIGLSGYWRPATRQQGGPTRTLIYLDRPGALVVEALDDAHKAIARLALSKGTLYKILVITDSLRSIRSHFELTHSLARG